MGSFDISAGRIQFVIMLRSRQNIIVALLCLDWQKRFYSDILERFAENGGVNNVRLLSMNNDAVLNMGVQLEVYWSEKFISQ